MLPDDTLRCPPPDPEDTEPISRGRLREILAILPPPPPPDWSGFSGPELDE